MCNMWNHESREETFKRDDKADSLKDESTPVEIPKIEIDVNKPPIAIIYHAYNPATNGIAEVQIPYENSPVDRQLKGLQKIRDVLHSKQDKPEYAFIVQTCREFKGPCFCGAHITEIDPMER